MDDDDDDDDDDINKTHLDLQSPLLHSIAKKQESITYLKCM